MALCAAFEIKVSILGWGNVRGIDDDVPHTMAGKSKMYITR